MGERLVIVGSAILARLICLALFDPALSYLFGDSLAYFQSSPYLAPGYPAFLAVAPFPLVIQSLLTILVALLAHDRLPRGGFVAALLIAASPFFPAFEWRILSDSLGWQLIFAAFLLIAFPKSRWDVLIAGLLLGVAALVRDTYQWLPLFALLFSAGIRRRMAVAALLAYLIILPWQVSQGRVGISEGRVAYNLWIGTWERNSDWMAKGVERADYPANAFTSAEQKRHLLELPLFTPESESRFKQTAIDRIAADPIATVSTWLIRYPKLWLGTRSDQIAWRISEGPIRYAAKAGLWLLNALLLTLGIVGMLLNWRRYPLLLAPIIYLALVYAPFHNVETRYSLGALPFLLIFAALAIRQIGPRMQQRFNHRGLSATEPV
ncbi:hypothetical protein LZ496_13800 [Sphingomonas sp. NSE70-1]|uniref:Dolichyl-phosphate-mannose-protein mannosyltransferase n=1 Tax=Sphingomonas caseinilyticus TaxID=2908205 RepID=A0ABT0RXV0_9SPHN|nr:hypothetical protein [Sphingomonas caseinilyticus]MCL6699849.1 hypothetical protein [Sphingomonas caseinilyticus]